MKQNFIKFFLLFLAFSASNGIQVYGAETQVEADIVLDVSTDLSEAWNTTETQNYCVYSESETDFDFAWGCPIPMTEDGVDTTDLVGYWATCKQTTCDIIYRGAKPISITVQYFLSANSKLTITARGTGAAFNQNVASLTSRDGTLKRIFLIDFQDAVAFKFTLTSAAGGYAVIEQITMDMEVKQELTTPGSVEPTTQGSGRGTPELMFVSLAFILVKLSLS